MNKKEFIAEVSKKVGFTQGDTKLLLNAMIEVLRDTLMGGDFVKIEGFMRAYVTGMAAYEGFSPFQNKHIPIPARKRVVFRVSRVIDKLINDKFAEESETDE